MGGSHSAHATCPYLALVREGTLLWDSYVWGGGLVDGNAALEMLSVRGRTVQGPSGSFLCLQLAGLEG